MAATDRTNRHIYSGAPWERQVAYCRARRVGPLVWVAGTTAVNAEGQVVAPGDAAGQARFVLDKIIEALALCEAGLEHVVRTRMYVRAMSDFPAVAEVHRTYFAGIDPVATCVEVSALADPNLLVEIEVDAALFDSASA